MATILERVMSRPDLDAMRIGRQFSDIADALNLECVETMLPVQVTAQRILDLSPHSDIIFALLQSAANGEPVQATAAALLADGVVAYEPGMVPPLCSPADVWHALYPDE